MKTLIYILLASSILGCAQPEVGGCKMVTDKQSKKTIEVCGGSSCRDLSTGRYIACPPNSK